MGGAAGFVRRPLLLSAASGRYRGGLVGKLPHLAAAVLRRRGNFLIIRPGPQRSGETTVAIRTKDSPHRAATREFSTEPPHTTARPGHTHRRPTGRGRRQSHSRVGGTSHQLGDGLVNQKWGRVGGAPPGRPESATAGPARAPTSSPTRPVARLLRHAGLPTQPVARLLHFQADPGPIPQQSRAQTTPHPPRTQQSRAQTPDCYIQNQQPPPTPATPPTDRRWAQAEPLAGWWCFPPIVGGRKGAVSQPRRTSSENPGTSTVPEFGSGHSGGWNNSLEMVSAEASTTIAYLDLEE